VLWAGSYTGRLYVLAAITGAVVGAVTNFLLCRYWAFQRTERHIAAQATLYALASFLTYLALQASLSLLIEVVRIDQRAAWFPAKAIAWLGVSYPMSRFVVFGARRQKALPPSRGSGPQGTP